MTNIIDEYYEKIRQEKEYAANLFKAQKDVEKMLDEFEERFPGKCPICSYHRFGLTHGYEKKLKPKKHYCPEKEKQNA